MICVHTPINRIEPAGVRLIFNILCSRMWWHQNRTMRVEPVWNPWPSESRARTFIRCTISTESLLLATHRASRKHWWKDERVKADTKGLTFEPPVGLSLTTSGACSWLGSTWCEVASVGERVQRGAAQRGSGGQAATGTQWTHSEERLRYQLSCWSSKRHSDVNCHWFNHHRRPRERM
jgi:hypothetical protein